MSLQEKILNEKVIPIQVSNSRTFVELIDEMGETAFQGRKLAEACKLYSKMLNEQDLTIFLGYSGSLSVAGQWRIITWLMENHYIDILVATGANISEDIVNSIGCYYYKNHANQNDEELFRLGINRYYDTLGSEKEYLEMTEIIASFIMTLKDNYNYTTREFLLEFGLWLNKQGIYSIVSVAAENGIPIYCPAIIDSPFGDAALIAKAHDKNVIIDSIKDYVEFMSISKEITRSGVIYIGGGVPKDFIQLLAVTPDLLYKERVVPNKEKTQSRNGTNETYYPHEFAIQITTDSPQWGGLSGCTFEEAVSWGKEKDNGNYVQCYCDATIALPIISQYISLKNNMRKCKIIFNN